MKALILLFLGTTLANPSGSRSTFGDEDTCAGYSACHPVDHDQINFHFLPHTHNDLNWLRNIDQYYQEKVKTIIDSVVKALKENPERRFIYAETAYLNLWWQDQSDAAKKDFIDLVNQGRLEIVGGGWSMNDEAVTNYQQVIDQFTLGFHFLEDTIGKCARPKHAWQIDAFGHSQEMATLFSLIGFDSVYMSRIDYRDLKKRETERTLEMMWRGSESLGKVSDIFVHAMKNYYSPIRFCFDIGCPDPRIIDDESSPDYNVKVRLTEFLELMTQQISIYDTPHILVPFGNDFHWQNATEFYINLERLKGGLKKYNTTIDGRSVNMIYSTVNCYTKAVNDYVTKLNKTLNRKTDDFLPYGDGGNYIWSGFYTTRPTTKRFERTSNNFLQASKQLKTLADLPTVSTYSLDEAMASMQHHDAVTGTEKTEVAKDNHRRLHKALMDAAATDNDALKKLLGSSADLGLKTCDLMNVSICTESDKDEFNVLLWNPLARSVSHHIQIPVNNGQWEVTDSDGKKLEVALTENVRDFSYIAKNISAKYLPKILIFKAANLPALGYKSYHIKKTGTRSENSENPENAEIKNPKSAVGKIGFDSNYINFDEKTGFLKSITVGNVTVDVKQQFMYYKSQDAGSGLYIFRPFHNTKDPEKLADNVTNVVTVSSGELIREVKQTWNDWITQVFRVYKDEDFIEIDWSVGPIDYHDYIAKEVITRFTTPLKTKSLFYTDANGRQLLERRRNFRKTYEYTNLEPQSANYYPVTSRISIKDDQKRFTIFNDRPQGGASLHDGELELMVHRMTKYHDGRGVEENLNETAYGKGLIVRGSLFLTTSDLSKPRKRSPAIMERDIAQRKSLAPVIFFTTKDIPKKIQSFLKKELPINVHLLTLDKYRVETTDEILIRLEHIMAIDEDSDLSKEITVDLTDAFTKFTIKSMKEYNLAGNIPLNEISKLKWPQIKNDLLKDSPFQDQTRDPADLKVKLAPMQIRTFRAIVDRK